MVNLEILLILSPHCLKNQESSKTIRKATCSGSISKDASSPSAPRTSATTGDKPVLAVAVILPQVQSQPSQP